MEYPMGLTPEQVRLGAGAVGAVGGPTLQRFVERHAGPDAAEAAQIRRTEAQARRAARAQQILDEYLMGHGVAPITGRDKVSAILQGTVGDAGTTGRARTEGFNTETAQRAAAEKSAAARAKQLGLPSTSTVFADAPGMTATDNGVLAPRDVVQQRAEATAAVQAQEEARRAEQLRKITQQGEEYAARQVARETPGPLSRFGRALGAAVKSPITGGALGGLGAALSVPEALERYRSGDTSGAVIAALGGISGLASMVPGLGIPAAVVGAGTIPAMYLNDIATIPVNMAGIGGMSVPNGLAPEDNLPVGFQIMAPAMQDQRMYSVGASLEASLLSQWGAPLLSKIPALAGSK
jgi:hypothetical protein